MFSGFILPLLQNTFSKPSSEGLKKQQQKNSGIFGLATKKSLPGKKPQAKKPPVADRE